VRNRTQRNKRLSIMYFLLLILYFLQLLSTYDLEFDCAAREHGLRYAITRQPWRSPETFQRVFDALEMTSRCNRRFDYSDYLQPHRQSSLVQQKASTANTVYVSPQGSNKNSGSKSSPFQVNFLFFPRSFLLSFFSW
jgi:hypothetical protein